MIGPRAIVGLALLCAFAFSTFAAPSALAKGTTAYTCVKAEKGEFEDAHCTKSKAGGAYKHEAIAAGSKTNIAITNKNTKNATTESTSAILGFRIGPMDGEFICQTVSGEGTLTNNAGTPMNVSGTATISFSECTLLPQATFPNCVLEGGVITTKASLSTAADSMEVKFSEDGESFAKFKLTKCKSESENLQIQIVGAYSAIPNGTTWETTKESSKGLTSGGGQAFLVSNTTVTMSATEPGIALTTTES